MIFPDILSFIFASVLLTLAPGPDIIFVMTQSAASGKKAGIMTALGLCTGLMVHTALAAYGISTLVTHYPLGFKLLKAAGSGYLLYLAYRAFKEESGFGNSDNLIFSNSFKLYRQGIIMNLLNPKVILFFLAFLPQFVKSGNNIAIQMLILGGVFIIQAIIVFSAVSVFAGYLGDKLKQNDFFGKYIGMIKGTIFILIAIRLLF